MKELKAVHLTPSVRNWLCIGTLLLLIAEEYLLSLWIRDIQWCAWVWALAGALVILTLFAFLYRQHGLAKWELSTFRKLFQSLVSSSLSFSILLFFLVHLEWISNSGYDAFFTENGFQWQSLLLMLVNIGAVAVSVFLYPLHACTKSPAERELVVSGLSRTKCGQVYKVSPRNIDLLIKPFLAHEWKEKPGAVAASRLSVIPSGLLPAAGADLFDPLKESFEDRGTKVFSFVPMGEHDVVREQYNRIITGAGTVGEIIHDLIGLLTGRDVTVTLEESVDYDDMKEALALIAKVLHVRETHDGIQDTGNTLLYISPGTGVIGSALTAFAIPGNRCVLYFTQAQADNELVPIGLETGGHNTIVEEMLDR